MKKYLYLSSHEKCLIQFCVCNNDLQKDLKVAEQHLIIISAFYIMLLNRHFFCRQNCCHWLLESVDIWNFICLCSSSVKTVLVLLNAVTAQELLLGAPGTDPNVFDVGTIEALLLVDTVAGAQVWEEWVAAGLGEVCLLGWVTRDCIRSSLH